jgi:hypothetical protein
VGFNEFGKYIKTEPYIPNEKDRNAVIDRAIQYTKNIELRR